MSQFVFVVCQNGAEAACRQEVQGAHPKLKLAFSRPGFLTFKTPLDSLASRFYLRSTLARTFGWSETPIRQPDSPNPTGPETGADDRMTENLVERIVAHATSNATVPPIHIWQRDVSRPGQRGFEPGPTDWVSQMTARLETALGSMKGIRRPKINRTAMADEKVLDVVWIDPGQWWLGWHYATTPQQRWPGGVPRIDRERKVLSRAYYKMHEALLWSGIRIQPGDVCAEIGSSPGGACQRLLETGAQVIAIDPAELDPTIVRHPNLVHLRRRGREVRKRDLAPVRWLMADLNVTPDETIGMIGELVDKGHLKNVRGLLLTLKLRDWDWIPRVPELIGLFRQFGYQVVKTRQLAFNRNEFCLLAARDAFVLRVSRRKRAPKQPAASRNGSRKRVGKHGNPRNPRANRPSDR